MPVTTSQQLSNYFKDFSETEVTFTKEVIEATRLDPQGVHLKCLGDQWPCVIYSSSMTSAKIITNLQPRLNESLQKANSLVSLRFSFRETERTHPIAFFVKARATGFNSYSKERPNLYFVTLDFTQQPPDDLILILGKMLEAKQNSKRRGEWRLPMSESVVKSLGILPDRASVTVDKTRYPAILRDISFSGCKAIIATADNSLGSNSARIRLMFQDPDEAFAIEADICRSDAVQGHDGICVSGFHYNEEKVPMAYKVRINTAMRSERAETE